MHRSLATVATSLAALAMIVTSATPARGGEGRQGVSPFYGAFGTEVPITVPGYRGLEPTVKVAYSSTGRDGFVGVGWSLAGASYIERMAPGAGAPSYDSSDSYALDGSEMVASTLLGGTHATKIQNYHRIKFDSGANKWYVWRKDGTKATYSPVFETSKGTFRWGITSIADTSGNAVSFDYSCDGSYECYLDTISYNGATVTFYRESRPDVVSYATGAGLAELRYRLKSIDVEVSGQRARAYSLGYVLSPTTGQSLLSSVQQFGRDASVDASGNVTGGTSLPGMQLGYQAGGNGELTASADESIGNDPTWSNFHTELSDINGDGLADIVALRDRRDSSSPLRWLSYLSNGDGTFTAAADQTLGSDATWSNFKAGLADINADGKADIVAVRDSVDENEPFRYISYLSNGDGTFTQADDQTLGSDASWSNFHAALADVNGDGAADIIALRDKHSGDSCSLRYITYLSNGDGSFSQVADVTDGSTASWSNFHAEMADVNGDGLADIMALRDKKSDSDQLRYISYLSNGDGTFTQADDLDLGNTATWSNFHAAMGDINGDGKADIMALRDRESDDDPLRYMSYLSNGDGSFVASADETIGSSPDWGNFHAEMADFNGDGQMDIVAVRDTKSDSDKLRYITYLSNGDGTFTQADDRELGNTATWKNFHVSPADIDGNGTMDLVAMRDQQSDEDPLRYLSYLNVGPVSDLLIEMENGLGGATTVTYTPSSAWNNTYLPVGLVFSTASAVTTTDGRGASSTASYRYEGALWSNTERRSLGFRKVTAVLDAAGNYTETYYHQHVGCIAKPETTYFKDATGKIYSYSQMYYDESQSAPYTSLMTERWDYQCNLDSSCRRVVSQLSYDLYGNVIETREHGDYDQTGDERTKVIGYVPNTSAYIVSKPAYTNLYEGIGTGGTLVEQSLTYYDGNTSYTSAPSVGLATKKRVWDSTTGGYVDRTTGYDGYGNPVAQTSARQCTTTTSYDTTYHLYPTGRCNCLGQCSTQAWDYVLGQPAGQTDINGNSETQAYDAMGRPSGKYYADGSWVEYDYLDWGNPSQQRTRETVSDGTADGLWSEVYHDGLGRTWRTEAEGGTRVDVLYSDLSNRVWKKSLPYAAGETVKYQVYAYDGAGRQVRATNPDGTYAEKIYGDSYVVDRNELGHEKTTWTDGLGQTVQIDEKNGTATYSTTFAYDASGNTTQVRDASGNISTMSYDSRGLKRSQCNPDSGCLSFEYDAEGAVAARTDAKGQRIEFAYDALGRMVSKTLPDGSEATWTYDEAGHGSSQGLLTSVTHPAGSESMSYDAIGRVTAAEKCVDGICYATTTAHDLAGRIASVAYPDGEVVSMSYDARGNLSGVSGYVNSISYNSRGQMTSIAYANGTTQSFEYDANRAWLTNAEVSGPSGTLYQAAYSYDAAARVSATSSNTNSLMNVSYSYDDLDRLLEVSGAQSQSFEYDALGRMTYNSEVGSYSYGDASHVHAVTSAGGTSYSYDANGNMTSGAGRALTWDAENRLTSVSQSGATVTFGYDARGQRVKKYSSGKTTRYYGSLLERASDGTLIKYISAGALRVAKKIGSEVTYYHADRLGSIRLMTNANGTVVREADFAPYGDTLAESGAHEDDFGFTGHREDDETGLVYMNARYYNAELARFVSADSIVPDPSNPQAYDRYAYAYDNPVNNVDPTGHAPVAAAVIGAVIGVATGVISVTVAVIAVACVAIGYVTKNPLLMSIGQVILGFATGGPLGGFVAALTSPVSPLDPKIKQIIGWAYTAYCLIKTFQQLSEQQDVVGGGTDRAGVEPTGNAGPEAQAARQAEADRLLTEIEASKGPGAAAQVERAADMAVNGVKADQVTGMIKNPDWKWSYNVYNPNNVPKYIEVGNVGVEGLASRGWTVADVIVDTRGTIGLCGPSATGVMVDNAVAMTLSAVHDASGYIGTVAGIGPGYDIFNSLATSPVLSETAGIEAFEMANPTAYNAAKTALKAEHPFKGWVADHLLGY